MAHTGDLNLNIEDEGPTQSVPGRRSGMSNLNQYPDHWTHGETLGDLKEHLRDLHETFHEVEIPGIKQVAELELA